jgi:hypothetical protein
MAMNPIFSTILEGATPGFLVAATLLAFMPWVSKERRWRILPIAFVLALTARYLYWRVTSTIPSPENPVDFIAGLLFFADRVPRGPRHHHLLHVTLTRKRNRSDDVECEHPMAHGASRPCPWSTSSSVPTTKTGKSSSGRSSARPACPIRVIPGLGPG